MPWPTPQSWSFGVTLKQEKSGVWFQAEEVDIEEKADDQGLVWSFPVVISRLAAFVESMAVGDNASGATIIVVTVT
eukprot:1208230-Amphidinium_carterae.1